MSLGCRAAGSGLRKSLCPASGPATKAELLQRLELTAALRCFHPQPPRELSPAGTANHRGQLAARLLTEVMRNGSLHPPSCHLFWSARSGVSGEIQTEGNAVPSCRLQGIYEGRNFPHQKKGVCTSVVT